MADRTYNTDENNNIIVTNDWIAIGDVVAAMEGHRAVNERKIHDYMNALGSEQSAELMKKEPSREHPDHYTTYLSQKAVAGLILDEKLVPKKPVISEDGSVGRFTEQFLVRSGAADPIKGRSK